MTATWRTVVLGMLVAFLPAAHAAAPTSINLQGVLRTSAGGLEDGLFAFRVRIFPDAASTVAFLDESFTGVAVNSGVFSLTVGGSTTGLAAALGTASAAEVELSVNGIPMPRQPLSSVAYALYAQSAANAVTADNANAAASVPFSGLTGVPAVCSAGSYLAGYASGSPACVAELGLANGGGVTATLASRTYTLGTDTTVQRRTAASNLMSCPSGYITSISQTGQATCAADQDTGATVVTPGAGINAAYTPANRTLTISNSGVTSIAGTAPIAASGATGSVTISANVGTAAGTLAAGNHAHGLGCYAYRNTSPSASNDVSCPAGRILISGGCIGATGPITSTFAYRDCSPFLCVCSTPGCAGPEAYNTWRCAVSSGVVSAFAICCNNPVQ